MGLKGEFKKWLFSIFGIRFEEFVFDSKDTNGKRIVDRKTVPICAIKDHMDNDEIPHVVVFDHTKKLKYCREGLKTGEEFFDYHFIAETVKPLNETKTMVVYVCLDRGSPSCKSIEHKSRYKVTESKKKDPKDDVEFKKLVERAKKTYISDTVGPASAFADVWKACISDKTFLSRLLIYLTVRFVGTKGVEGKELLDAIARLKTKSPYASLFDDTKERCEYIPPPNKRLYLFGGKLDSNERCADVPFMAPNPLDKLIVIEGVDTSGVDATLSDQNARSSIYRRFSSKRRVYFDDSPDRIVLSNLLEGEIQAMHFAYKHTLAGEDVMIVTPDGDVLMMALLSSVHRLDPSTGKFINRIFVCLEIPGGAGRANTKQYVNVNELWWNIYSSQSGGHHCDSYSSSSSSYFDSKPIFYKGLNHPSFQFVSQICFVGMSCGGTDYVEHCSPGVVNRTKGIDFFEKDDTIKRDDVPCVFSERFLRSRHEDFDAFFNTKSIATTTTKPRASKSVASRGKNANNDVVKSSPTTKMEALKSISIPAPMYAFLRHYHDPRFLFYDILTIRPIKVDLESRYIMKAPLHHIPFAFQCDVFVNEEAFIRLVNRTYVEQALSVAIFTKRYKNAIETQKMSDVACARRYYYEDKMEELKKEMLAHENARKEKTCLSSKDDREEDMGLEMHVKSDVELYARKKRIKSSRMPEARRSRVNARRALWQTTYYVNSYRDRCLFPDPTFLYEGLPLYGWYIDASGECKIASRVSKHPSKVVMIPFNK